MTIREYLKENRLFTDGAMGTYYEKKYHKVNAFSEKDNLIKPERILDIHMEYLKAGARLIRTNTFASNSMFLGTMEEVVNNVRAGYEIACEARDCFVRETGCTDDIFIAADLGPLHATNMEDDEALQKEYQQICDAFLECKADIFVFETLTEMRLLLEIARYIKEKSDAFIIAQFSFDKSGYTSSGLSLKAVIETMAQCPDIDAYGLNCGVEAAHMYQLLKNQEFPNEKYLTALPNAGYPVSVRGRTVYADNEQYFVKMSEKLATLGIDIIGGCCGTTPAYIKSLSKILKDVSRPQKRVRGEHGEAQRSAVAAEPNPFMEKLKRGEKVYVVELDPPVQNDITKVLNGAKILKDTGIDLLTLADSPMARSRMDAGALAVKVQREIGITVMPHMCCRDKNLIALRGSIMGDYVNEIRQLLIVTGDPVSRENRGKVTAVFDVNSIRLMDCVKNMNQELYEEDPMICGGALNFHGANPQAIARRMTQKMEAGCEYFLTQPIYSKEDIERIKLLKEMTGARIICGIMPLVSYKNALFIHNEMPGIVIPEEVLNSYNKEMTREEAEKVAIRISVGIAKDMEHVADGYYFMTPFYRAGLIRDIIQKIRG